MNNDYREVWNHIAPTQEQSERMRRVILAQQAAPQTRRRAIRHLPAKLVAVVAAVACLGSLTVFADDIRGLFTGHLANDPVVGEQVFTPAFSDENEDVRIVVDEVLSDLTAVQMTFHYEGLTENGNQWIDTIMNRGDYFGTDDIPEAKRDRSKWSTDLMHELSLMPKTAVRCSYSNGITELKEARTDTERYFVVDLTAACADWGFTEVVFRYPLASAEQNRTATIDISQSMQQTVVKLKDPTPSQYYIPAEVAYSPLSITIFAKQIEPIVLENGFTEEDVERSNQVSEELPAFFLRKTDGTDVSLLSLSADGCGQSAVNRPDGVDLMLISLRFPTPQDVSTFAGSTINGAYYPFS